MEKQIRSWREQAVGLGRRGRGSRYPVEMRARAVRMCRAVEASGGTAEKFAEELGVAASTLSTWLLQEEAPEEAPHGALVPVTLVADSAGSLVRVQLGRAHADVNLAQLAELVRRLS